MRLNQSVFSYFSVSINMDFFWPVQNNNVSKLIAAYCIIFYGTSCTMLSCRLWTGHWSKTEKKWYGRRLRNCDKIKRLALWFNKTWGVYIASLSDCNERKGEVLKDLECLSHIVIDFWFQGDLVHSLLLTGRSRAVCRFTLSIFFVLRAVGWPLFSQHDCMSHMQYSYMTLLSPVSQEALHHLSLCHATRDIAWTTKQMEVKKDTKSKGEKSKSKNRFQYKAEGSNQTQSMIVSGSALSHLGAPRLRVRPSSIRL